MAALSGTRWLCIESCPAGTLLMTGVGGQSGGRPAAPQSPWSSPVPVQGATTVGQRGCRLGDEAEAALKNEDESSAQRPESPPAEPGGATLLGVSLLSLLTKAQVSDDHRVDFCRSAT